VQTRLAMLIPVVLSLLPWLSGQTSSTEVLGTVTDTSGLVISRADAILTRQTTGETRTAKTDQDGIYLFPLVEPANYSVEVKMAGFKVAKILNIDVLFQQRARVNVTLEVGQLTQLVEVQAEARLLNTEDAAVGQNIESHALSNSRSVTVTWPTWPSRFPENSSEVAWAARPETARARRPAAAPSSWPHMASPGKRKA
jgi:carboxypeptidase family protein